MATPSIARQGMCLYSSHRSNCAKLSAKAWALFSGCSPPRPGQANKIEVVFGRDKNTQGHRQCFPELRQQQGPGLLKPHTSINKQALISTGLHSQSGHRKVSSAHHQSGGMTKSMGIFPTINCFPYVWHFDTKRILPNLDEFS